MNPRKDVTLALVKKRHWSEIARRSALGAGKPLEVQKQRSAAAAFDRDQMGLRLQFQYRNYRTRSRFGRRRLLFSHRSPPSFDAARAMRICASCVREFPTALGGAST